MVTKQLTERQAWRLIRKAFSERVNGKCTTELNWDISKWGMCVAISNLMDKEIISLETCRAMEKDIERDGRYRYRGPLGYWWEHDNKSDLKRVEWITRLLKKKGTK
jgi:hypothetical protein